MVHSEITFYPLQDGGTWATTWEAHGSWVLATTVGLPIVPIVSLGGL